MHRAQANCAGVLPSQLLVTRKPLSTKKTSTPRSPPLRSNTRANGSKRPLSVRPNACVKITSVAARNLIRLRLLSRPRQATDSCVADSIFPGALNCILGLQPDEIRATPHRALLISVRPFRTAPPRRSRSEEHTSEL